MFRSDQSEPQAIAQARRLATLFHRRWTVPILAQLHRERGSRFVSLAYRLGASEGALRATLDELVADGLVAPNPGYGHPLRPEYVLTESAAELAPICGRLDTLIDTLHVREVGLRKWSMPVLFVVGRGPTRFTHVTGSLAVATDRAVAIALKNLSGAGLIDRTVSTGFPPASTYAASRAGRRLTPLLAHLSSAAA